MTALSQAQVKWLITGVILGLLAVGVLLAAPPPARASTTWNVGDVFAGVAGGAYNVYDNSGTFKETISSGLGGFTTGCAFNPTLTHLYTTQFSAGQITKFDNASPHSSASIASTRPVPESIAFRADGSYLVGGPFGGGIDEYDATDTLVTSYAVLATGPTGGARLD
ncbi:MAG: hypothetical protein HY532_08720 [Chloroflexi bacterium]|nr:hypothetical protein [Chloroflexota bacterium]